MILIFSGVSRVPWEWNGEWVPVMPRDLELECRWRWT